MKLFIPKDYFNNPTPPEIYLCNTSKRILGHLPAYDRRGTFKWNTYSEIQFSVDRTYVDALTGETKVHPLFDKIESPRNVYVKNIGYFSLQDIDTSHGDKDTKTVTAFSLEYSTLGTKYLTNFKVNKGEVDSKEVIYLASIYGEDYSPSGDSLYTQATGAFDPYESYYIKDYTDNDSSIWTQVEIRDASVYATYDKSTAATTLYVKKYPNVRFYYPTKPQLSLLHLILESCPEWKIGTVDVALWRKERSFDESRVAIYDFLTGTVADTFGCVIEFDTLTSTINVYEEVDDGITEDNEVATRWATDVLISRDNLASEINVSYSSDNIKTKLTVSGADDLNISEINLGRNEIMNLSFYHTLDWMEPDLFEAYDDYLEAVDEANTGLDKYGLPSTTYPMSYSDAVQKWVAAYNKWNDLMNAVPAENDTVLVGDEFKKLYCMYTPIDTAFVKATIPEASPTDEFDTLYFDPACTPDVVIDESSLSDGDAFIVQGYEYQYNSTTNKFDYLRRVATTTAFDALVEKLGLYHVDEDVKGNKNDNVLLKLKNANSDIATIRIYDPKRLVNDNYKPGVRYYTKAVSASGVETYTRAYINSAEEFTAYDKNSLYTNNYTVQSVVVRATSGLSDAPSYWATTNENISDGNNIQPFTEWIKGNLTAEAMDLEDYTVSYIGTMGAYLVLAENEFVMTNDGPVPSKDYLRTYGVNLLKEKHEIYTTIFKTQTEAMYSQEDYQCVASAEAPTGTIANETRWFDTDSNPPALYKWNGQSWVSIETDADPADLENYQRYMDNYLKLQAVQEVLLEKEHEAEYCLNGYSVTTNPIYFSEYTMDSDGYYRRNGQLLEGDMQRAAESHFWGNRAYLKSSPTSSSIGKSVAVLYSDEKCLVPVDNLSLKNGAQFVVDGYAYVYNKASNNFKCENNDFIITRVNIEQYLPLYKFTISKYPGIEFAVYLSGNTPYVAYADSRGVYQMIRNYIRDKTEMSNFFTEDQWIRLSPFIREDEFNDSNFLLNGYESEEERLNICKELVEAASKELNTLCQPSLEFSMTMANILALPEFAPLIDQFQLGNFIRVHIRDGYVKRSRLLEVDLNFDDLSDFNATFGNLVTTKSEIDKHAELLSQAVSAGKQVAAAASDWQRAVDKSNKLEEAIASGLQDAALQVGRASGQAISWDQNGFFCRKFLDGTTDQYENEQIAIINNKIVFTNDGWQTSKAALGEFQVDTNGDGVAETMYGLLADAVVSGYVKGSVIEGGSLKIGGTGGTFIVNEDGSVEILGPDAETPVYATKDSVDLVNNARQYYTELAYSGSTIFTEPGQSCKITCKVFSWDSDITDKVKTAGGTFSWIRSSNSDDSIWNASHSAQTSNEITITNEDIVKNAQFSCEVQFDDEKITF